METINDIVREIRAQQNGNVHTISAKEAYALADRVEAAHKQAIIDAVKTAVATKCEVCMHPVTQAALKAKAAGEGYAAGKQSVTDCNQHETVDLESRCVYGEAKDAEPVGNAAKMREALLKSRKAMDEMSKSIFQGWIEDSLVDVVGEAQRAISPALSEPPRNCDRFANDNEARKAFIDWYNTWYDVKGDKWFEIDSTDLKHNVDDILQDYINWLFAEAKGEKK